MTYTLYRGAELDLAEAARFYRREGGRALAAWFLDEFGRIAEFLVEHPGIGTLGRMDGPQLQPHYQRSPWPAVHQDVLAVFNRQWYHFAMIDWSSCSAVERDPERVSGAWVFLGTRVPVAALFENLEDGALVSQFVEWFPGVTHMQVRTVLEHAARSALAPA